MARRRPYRIEYAPETQEHLTFLDTRDQATVVDAVERQLRHQPTVQTRNRKPLEANPVAPWELRVGDIRVYFETAEEPERIVKIVAIGRKDRERVLIGGVEVELR